MKTMKYTLLCTSLITMMSSGVRADDSQHRVLSPQDRMMQMQAQQAGHQVAVFKQAIASGKVADTEQNRARLHALDQRAQTFNNRWLDRQAELQNPQSWLKRHWGKVTAVLGILLAGGGAAWYFNRDTDEKPADAPSSASNDTSTTVTTAGDTASTTAPATEPTVESTAPEVPPVRGKNTSVFKSSHSPVEGGTEEGVEEPSLSHSQQVLALIADAAHQKQAADLFEKAQSGDAKVKQQALQQIGALYDDASARYNKELEKAKEGSGDESGAAALQKTHDRLVHLGAFIDEASVEPQVTTGQSTSVQTTSDIPAPVTSTVAPLSAPATSAVAAPASSPTESSVADTPTYQPLRLSDHLLVDLPPISKQNSSPFSTKNHYEGLQRFVKHLQAAQAPAERDEWLQLFEHGGEKERAKSGLTRNYTAGTLEHAFGELAAREEAVQAKSGLDKIKAQRALLRAQADAYAVQQVFNQVMQAVGQDTKVTKRFKLHGDDIDRLDWNPGDQVSVPPKHNDTTFNELLAYWNELPVDTHFDQERGFVFDQMQELHTAKVRMLQNQLNALDNKKKIKKKDIIAMSNALDDIRKIEQFLKGKKRLVEAASFQMPKNRPAGDSLRDYAKGELLGLVQEKITMPTDMLWQKPQFVQQKKGQGADLKMHDLDSVTSGGVEQPRKAFQVRDLDNEIRVEWVQPSAGDSSDAGAGSGSGGGEPTDLSQNTAAAQAPGAGTGGGSSNSSASPVTSTPATADGGGVSAQPIQRLVPSIVSFDQVRGALPKITASPRGLFKTHEDGLNELMTKIENAQTPEDVDAWIEVLRNGGKGPGEGFFGHTAGTLTDAIEKLKKVGDPSTETDSFDRVQARQHQIRAQADVFRSLHALNDARAQREMDLVTAVDGVDVAALNDTNWTAGPRVKAYQTLAHNDQTLNPRFRKLIKYWNELPVDASFNSQRQAIYDELKDIHAEYVERFRTKEDQMRVFLGKEHGPIPTVYWSLNGSDVLPVAQYFHQSIKRLEEVLGHMSGSVEARDYTPFTFEVSREDVNGLKEKFKDDKGLEESLDYLQWHRANEYAKERYHDPEDAPQRQLDNLSQAKIAATWHAHTAKKAYDSQRKAATKIATRWRGKKARNDYGEAKQAATQVQSVWRGHKARKDLERAKAATRIQSAVRMHNAKGDLETAKNSASLIAAGWRGKMTRNRVSAERAERAEQERLVDKMFLAAQTAGGKHAQRLRVLVREHDAVKEQLNDYGEAEYQRRFDAGEHDPVTGAGAGAGAGGGGGDGDTDSEDEGETKDNDNEGDDNPDGVDLDDEDETDDVGDDLTGTGTGAGAGAGGGGAPRTSAPNAPPVPPRGRQGAPPVNIGGGTS